MHVLFAYSVFSFIINYFLIKILSDTFNLYMLDSIFRMNFSVVKEFFDTNFKLKHFLLAFVFIFLSIGIKKISLSYVFNAYFNYVFIAILFLFGIYFISREVKKAKQGNKLRSEQVFLIKNIIVIYGYFFGEYAYTYTNYKKVQNIYKNNFLKRSKIQAKNNIKNVVLVMGEALSRNKCGLYNDLLQVNPYLKKIQSSGNLVLFSDVIAPYSSTNTSLSFILNFANYENTTKDKPFYSYLDIVSLFKLASYKTFYLSNQEYIAKYSNMATSVGVQADEQYFCNKDFLNPDDVVLKAKPDEILLKALEKMPSSDKNFYIFHLMGNHAEYKKRYSKDFNIFNKENISDYVNLSDDKKQIVAEYLNATLYNDFVVNSIYEKFSDEDSIIIYFSDHGEAIYDDKTKNVCNHGIVDKVVAEIPFMIMFSDIFKHKHPEIVEKIQKSKDKPYMTDDFIHTICEIAGIEIDEFEPKRSIINDSFNDNRKRLFVGSIDYDLELKE